MTDTTAFGIVLHQEVNNHVHHDNTGTLLTISKLKLRMVKR